MSSLRQFYFDLANHDWFTAWSDDKDVYWAGQERFEELEAICSEGGEYATLFQAFRMAHFSGDPWGTEKLLLPPSPDLSINDLIDIRAAFEGKQLVESWSGSAASGFNPSENLKLRAGARMVIWTAFFSESEDAPPLVAGNVELMSVWTLGRLLRNQDKHNLLYIALRAPEAWNDSAWRVFPDHSLVLRIRAECPWPGLSFDTTGLFRNHMM